MMPMAIPDVVAAAAAAVSVPMVVGVVTDDGIDIDMSIFGLVDEVCFRDSAGRTR